MDISIISYQVEKCGYYAKKGELCSSDLIETLEDLSKWVEGKTLALTCPEEPQELQDSEEAIPYCFCVKKLASTNNYLLVLWNRVLSNEGSVQSVSERAVVGKANVSLTALKDGDIPGYPSYFYFIADKNLLFGLRPPGTRTDGHRALRKFLNYFLRVGTRHVQRVDNTEDPTVWYTDNEGRVNEQLEPQFKFSLKQLKNIEQFLVKNCDRIYKVVKKGEFSPKLEEKTTPRWKWLFALFFGYHYSEQQKVSFSYEIPCEPKIEDLKRLIKEGYEDRGVRTGFKLRKDSSTIRWLDSMPARSVLITDFEMNERKMIPIEKLLKECEKSSELFVGMSEQG